MVNFSKKDSISMKAIGIISKVFMVVFVCLVTGLSAYETSINDPKNQATDDSTKGLYVSEVVVDNNNNVQVKLGNVKYEQKVKVTVFKSDKIQQDKYAFGVGDRIVISNSKNYFDMNFIALDPSNPSGDFWVLMEFSNGQRLWKQFRVNTAVL